MANTEKRSYKRLDLTLHRLEATLAIISEGGQVTGCVVPLKDLSKSGAGIYLKTKLENGTFLRFAIQGMDQFKHLDAKVMWCTSAAGDPKAPATHPFRAGIDFKPKDDDDRENQLALYFYIFKMVSGSQKK